MSSALASLCALALCFSGMAALSLAMDRHCAQLTGRDELARSHRIGLRALGGLLLAGSLWTCIGDWGPGVGLVAWCGWLTGGAMLAALTLTYAPRWTAGSAAASAAIATLAVVAA